MADRRRGGRRSGGFAVAVAAVSAVLLAGCTGEPSPADVDARYEQVQGEFDGALQERLEGLLDEGIRLSGSSGGIAGVWAPWAGEWVEASGRSRFGKRAPAVTTDTPFRATTISSEVTCTVLLELVDEGVVRLDEPVGDVLQHMPKLGTMTLGQLCQGTAGLRDYYSALENNFLHNPERAWSNIELVSDALASPRVGDPGEQWGYSRAGVLLVALALQQRTGESWAALADHYVFDPLGLDRTRFPDPHELLPDGLLGGYASPGGAQPDCSVVLDERSQSPTIGGAAAGAITDLEELRVLTQVLADSSLLSEEQAEAQWTTVSKGPKRPGWQRYGLGGESYGPLRGAAGEQPGTLTAAFADPESGLTVVVTLNNSTSGPGLVRELAFALASAASKADAVDGRSNPHVGLPWSLEQAETRMAEAAKCPLPAPEEQPKEG